MVATLGSQQWTQYIPIFYLPASYPILTGIQNTNITAVAAAPLFLSNNNTANNVISAFFVSLLDFVNGGGIVSWQTTRLSMVGPMSVLVGAPNIYPGYRVHNTNANNIGQQENMVAFIDVGFYRYQKTVPLNINGIFLKSNLAEDGFGIFDVSEVFPNIVTNNATVEVSTAQEGNLNVAIYDLSGSKIMDISDQFINANTKIKVDLNNLSNLSTGVYTVVVSIGNDVAIRKFIKQ